MRTIKDTKSVGGLGISRGTGPDLREIIARSLLSEEFAESAKSEMMAQ